MTREEEEKKLISLMEDISECCWSAGWLIGHEYQVWNVIKNGYENSPYYRCDYCDPFIEVKAISEKLNCWVRFNDEIGEAEIVKMDEWNIEFDEWLELSDKKKQR